MRARLSRGSRPSPSTSGSQAPQASGVGWPGCGAGRAAAWKRAAKCAIRPSSCSRPSVAGSAFALGLAGESVVSGQIAGEAAVDDEVQASQQRALGQIATVPALQDRQAGLGGQEQERVEVAQFGTVDGLAGSGTQRQDAAGASGRGRRCLAPPVEYTGDPPVPG